MKDSKLQAITGPIRSAHGVQNQSLSRVMADMAGIRTLGGTSESSPRSSWGTAIAVGDLSISTVS